MKLHHIKAQKIIILAKGQLRISILKKQLNTLKLIMKIWILIGQIDQSLEAKHVTVTEQLPFDGLSRAPTFCPDLFLS